VDECRGVSVVGTLLAVVVVEIVSNLVVRS